MATKKMVAILGTCLSLISGCSTSIPISNEQISKDIFSKRYVVITSQNGTVITTKTVSFFTGTTPDGKAFKDLNGDEYHHCFKVDSSDFSQETGKVEITLFSTGLTGAKTTETGELTSYNTHIQTSLGKAKLIYKKKGDGWAFKDLSFTDDDTTPLIIRDVTGPEMKLTVGVSKPLCDNFDSSKSNKQVK
jgi:hypothetical protein